MSLDKNKADKILLYDDKCAICSISATKIVASSKGSKDIKLIPAGSKIAKQLSKDMQLNTSESVYFIKGNKIYSDEKAVLEVLKQMNKFWRSVALALERVVPHSLMHRVYKFIARNRKILNKFLYK